MIMQLTKGMLPLLALATSSVLEEHPQPTTAIIVLLTETISSLNSFTALVLLHCEGPVNTVSYRRSINKYKSRKLFVTFNYKPINLCKLD